MVKLSDKGKKLACASAAVALVSLGLILYFTLKPKHRAQAADGLAKVKAALGFRSDSNYATDDRTNSERSSRYSYQGAAVGPYDGERDAPQTYDPRRKRVLGAPQMTSLDTAYGDQYGKFKTLKETRDDEIFEFRRDNPHDAATAADNVDSFGGDFKYAFQGPPIYSSQLDDDKQVLKDIYGNYYTPKMVKEIDYTANFDKMKDGGGDTVSATSARNAVYGNPLDRKGGNGGNDTGANVVSKAAALSDAYGAAYGAGVVAPIITPQSIIAAPLSSYPPTVVSKEYTDLLRGSPGV